MMNFEQGSALADRQDRVFRLLKNGEPVLYSDKKMLRENRWVRWAKRLAPSNLVVRHLVLLDLIEGEPRNQWDILTLCTQIAPDLWAEGYSYWLYTKPFLVAHVKRFNSDMYHIAVSIDRYFWETSYERNGHRYPAPFGDLRDRPMESIPCPPDIEFGKLRRLKFLWMEKNIYIISPYLLGMNTHVPSKRNTISIIDGRPVPFTFYNGYNNKYASKKEELRDTFNPRRIFSLFRRR